MNADNALFLRDVYVYTLRLSNLHKRVKRDAVWVRFFLTDTQYEYEEVLKAMPIWSFDFKSWVQAYMELFPTHGQSVPLRVTNRVPEKLNRRAE